MDHLLSREKDTYTKNRNNNLFDFLKFEFDKFYLVLRDLISQNQIELVEFKFNEIK